MPWCIGNLNIHFSLWSGDGSPTVVYLVIGLYRCIKWPIPMTFQNRRSTWTSRES